MIGRKSQVGEFLRMTITARTRLIALIGHPASDTGSPPAVNAWLEEHDVDARMVALDVPPADLPHFLALLRGSDSFLGCSVTYPHKQAAFAAVDAMTERARRLGALNTIRRAPDGQLHGDATDGLAMVSALSAIGHTLSGSSARILGAGGGAGRAIADAFAEAGARVLCLEDTDAERHERTHTLIRSTHPDVRIAVTSDQRFGICVNATTLGKATDDPVPFAGDGFVPDTIYCDVVTAPVPTPMMRMAQAASARTVSGHEMARHQVEAQMRVLGLG